MHPKFIGGARSVLLLALACGANACGSSRSGDLFKPNVVGDAGLDGAVLPEEGGSPTSAQSSDTTSTGDTQTIETTETAETSETSEGSSVDPSTGATTTSEGSTLPGTDDSTSTGPNSGFVPDPTTDVTDTSTPPETTEGGGTTDVSTVTSDVGTTDVPTTDDSTTDVSTTDVSTTDVSTTDVSTTDVPTTDDSTTDDSTTDDSTDPVPPTCLISTPSKTLLNGVSSPLGDRVNDPDAPFKTAITVSTDAPDGSNVTLSTGDGPSLLVQAAGGLALFPAVELDPNGEYTLVATCAGEVVTQSDPLVVTVDTVAPAFGAGIVPVAGQHYSPGDDENPSTPDVLDFSVCVPVASQDALGLDAPNVCVWTGAAGPFCATAVEDGVAPGTDGVCIPVVCPGSAPFNVDLRVTDEAGNPTTTQVGGVTCASQTPTVAIVSLTDNRDTPSDVGIRLLASGNPNPDSVLQDADPNTSGAQHAVVACTNATLGSSAELFVGLEGGSVTSRATATVQADVDEVCPTGLHGIVTFATTTLDSSTVVSGALQAYTVVRVSVTDTSTEMGTSPDVHVWVDPTLPVVTVLFPTGLCQDGVLATNDAEVIESLNMRSGGVYPIHALLVDKSDESVVGSYTFTSSSDFVDVTFPLGHYSWRAEAMEVSGNLGILGDCDIQVADLPQITWDNPLATTSALVGSGVVLPNSIQDNDAVTPGWQGTFQVTISPPLSGSSLDGMQVQFQVGGVDVGSPIDLVDAGGAGVQATLNVGLLDAENVSISAILTGAAIDVISTLTGIVIDTAPPEAVSDLLAAIEVRRETSMRLSWTPPNGVSGYDVVYLPVEAGDVITVIDESNFDTATPAPDAPGDVATVVVHDLMIEQRYLFAVRPYDSFGNLGPITATTTPVRATFETLVLAPPLTAPPGSQWGYSVDASTDLNGDGLADMVVGQKAGDRVSIYLGQPGGTYPSVPNVTIIGPASTGFGTSVAVVGNIVGDGFEDIAIASPEDGLLLGRVYIVAGRAWTNEVIDLSDGTNPGGSVIDFPTTTPLPMHVVRLGDFDGDGDLDFGIHGAGYGPTGACDVDTFENCDGALIIVRGVAASIDFPSEVFIPDDTAMFEAYFPSNFGFYGADWLLGITGLAGNRSGVLAAEYQAGVQRIMTRNTEASGGFDAQLLDYGPPQFDSNDELIFDTEIGSYPAALLGSSTLAVQLTGARNGLRSTPGVVDLYQLSPTDTFGAGPYKTFLAGGFTNNFGQILVGNRYSGRPSGYNLPFFGRDPEARSLIMGGGRYENKLPKLFMVGPQKLAELAENPATQELTGQADVEYFLSSVAGVNPDWTDDLGVPSEEEDWQGGIGFPIRDMDGDGFADIGITEWDFSITGYTGGMIILY